VADWRSMRIRLEGRKVRRIAMLTVWVLSFAAFQAAVLADDVGVSQSSSSTRELVNPAQPTFTENAYFNLPGELQLEGGYTLRGWDGDVGLQHVVALGGSLSIADLVEAQLRWDLFNVQSSDVGVGDITAGLKGGFFGGLGDAISLAGLFQIEFPSGVEPFGLDKGVGLSGGAVVTQRLYGIQFDLQALIYTHAFQSEASLELPLSLAATWAPVNAFRVYGEAIERLDLTDLSASGTSLLAGVGFVINRQLVANAGFRLGLSQSVPDFELSTGVTWLMGDLF
jgi:hypothetical protein